MKNIQPAVVKISFKFQYFHSLAWMPMPRWSILVPGLPTGVWRPERKWWPLQSTMHSTRTVSWAEKFSIVSHGPITLASLTRTRPTTSHTRPSLEILLILYNKCKYAERGPQPKPKYEFYKLLNFNLVSFWWNIPLPYSHILYGNQQLSCYP